MPNLSENVRAAYLLYSCPFPGSSYCPPRLLPTCHLNTCPFVCLDPSLMNLYWNFRLISSPINRLHIQVQTASRWQIGTVVFHGHCDQSHLSVLPWDSLCGQDKYNHISLKNNIVCNPRGKLCLAFLLHKSQWESDLAWPMPHELASSQAYPQPDMLFLCQYNFSRGAVKLCMRLISENKY